MATIAVTIRSDLTAAEIAGFSERALDARLTADAELLVATPKDEAIALGFFQRKSEVSSPWPFVRRGSGGAAARVGSGTIWVSLALSSPSALLACSVEQLLNRYVRPLLRAIGSAHYYGRDWIAVDKRPVASVAFGFSTTTGQALFEAFVGVTTPFALGPRASFRDREPALVPVTAEAIADAYAMTHERTNLILAPAAATPVEDAPAWDATREEPIGLLAASSDGTLGGEIMGAREDPRQHAFGFSPANAAALLRSSL